MSLSVAKTARSPLAVMAQWWRDWSGGPVTQDSDETARIAHDVNVTSFELERLNRLGPHAADLMEVRMAQFDLDRDEVARLEPGVLQDLQRVCSFCTSHRRCGRDVARDPADTTWKSYCPNIGTFEALDGRPWESRREW